MGGISKSGISKVVFQNDGISKGGISKKSTQRKYGCYQASPLNLKSVLS